jgi:hypothetical protein
MTDTVEYWKSAEILAESLHLRQPPVEVCFTESLPSGISDILTLFLRAAGSEKTREPGPLQRLPETIAGVP